VVSCPATQSTKPVRAKCFQGRRMPWPTAPQPAPQLTTSACSCPADMSQVLRVRATPLAAIAAGQPHRAWRPLFTSESLSWPGFVEFDVNDVAVTCCAQTRWAGWCREVFFATSMVPA
jgi:hypothetical protein